MHRRGELVSRRLVGYRLGPEPLVVIRVRVIDRQQPHRRNVRVRWIVAGAATGAAALTVGGYLVYLATADLMAHLGQVLGGLAVLHLLGWFAAGQAGSCPGLHCPACKCRR